MTWAFLSHVLGVDTPLYSGDGAVRIDRVRAIAAGHTSNNSVLGLPAHAGTHVDAPSHFDAAGLDLESFPAGHWRAERPWLIDCPSDPGAVVGVAELGAALDAMPDDADFLLLRTGAEQWRSVAPDVYSRQGVGVSPDVAAWLREKRRIRFFGIDSISVSSPVHRELGRAAHRAFLGPHSCGSPPILLIEDMCLGALDGAPAEIWVLPLRFDHADGAPATVVARVGADSLKHGGDRTL